MKRVYDNIDLDYFWYGKPSKSLKKAVMWLNRRKKRFQDINSYFDFPDYWDMPKSITRYLSSDDVDFLQEQTYDWTHLSCNGVFK